MPNEKELLRTRIEHLRKTGQKSTLFPEEKAPLLIELSGEMGTFSVQKSEITLNKPGGGRMVVVRLND